ncbi:MAG TPA: hypothetical protein ENG59_04245 [Chloroflexi bacterium]|nr:MAG: hypothetical protein DRI46_04105 [Chloroflexota bacterium]HDD55431.1 hypothetical protein [Chloroflexota bacterium]
MPKIFYTERDIEDLYHSGVTTLVVNDDVVVTDLAREKARKLGVELLKEHDQPSSAPIRPYITKNVSPSAAPPMPQAPSPAPTRVDLETRVYQAVQAQVGDSVDPGLLKTVIQRVLKNVGGS